MIPFPVAFEKKKFLQQTEASSRGFSTQNNLAQPSQILAQKPFVVIFHQGETSHVHDVIDALTSLHMPFVVKSTLDSSDDVKRADIMIFFKDDPKLYELAFQNLCVPVAPRSSKSTKDYNAVLESGNGFYFQPENKWEVFAALIRACETFQFPYDWENLLREIHNSK